MRTLLGLVVLAGCASKTSTSPPPPPPPPATDPADLVSIIAEPAGAHCAVGGVRVEIGPDADGDGSLEETEVASTAYLCNAPATVAMASLVDVAVEPPGAHCPSGGEVIASGVDANGNGVLDANEIADTSYVCDASTATAMLSEVQPEPPGLNCAIGGERVISGSDTNGNGQLDSTEIATTRYVCSAATGSQLVSATAEPAGAHCAHGGQLLAFGLDANANGQLEGGEVALTAYLCAGSDGAAELVGATAEMPGAHCSEGGEAITAGLDANGNGVLDAAEAGAAAYVCAGAHTPIAQVHPEAAGANCANGGSAIRVGIDANGDGVLDAAEASATRYLCSQKVLQGDFTIQNSIDVATLAGYTGITGNLTITASSLTSIVLDGLTYIGGNLAITSIGANAEIDLDTLQTVGGSVSSAALAKLELPLLGAVPQNVTLASPGVDVPLLASIGGSFTITTSNTTTQHLPALTTVASMALFGAPNLDIPLLQTITNGLYVGQIASPIDLTTPSLTSVSSVQVNGGNGASPSVTWHAPLLTAIATDLVFDATGTMDLPVLTSIRDMTVAASAIATVVTLNAPALQTARDLYLAKLASSATITVAPTLHASSLTIDTVPSITIGIGSADTITVEAQSAVMLVATTVQLPNLTANTLITLGDEAAATLQLDALVTAGTIQTKGGALVALTAPQLQYIDTLFATNCSQVTLPALATAGSISLTQPCSGTFDFPVLTSANSMSIGAPFNAPVLTTLPQGLAMPGGGGNTPGSVFTLPALSSVGSISLDALTITGISLPALTSSGAVTISDMNYFASFSAPQLTHIAGKLTIHDQESFATCRAQALAAQTSPTSTQFFDLPSGPCP